MYKFKTKYEFRKKISQILKIFKNLSPFRSISHFWQNDERSNPKQTNIQKNYQQRHFPKLTTIIFYPLFCSYFRNISSKNTFPCHLNLKHISTRWIFVSTDFRKRGDITSLFFPYKTPFSGPLSTFSRKEKKKPEENANMGGNKSLNLIFISVFAVVRYEVEVEVFFPPSDGESRGPR